jgi:hypothetical protein
MPKFYKIIKYCRTCKKKFFVTSEISRSYYCEDCVKKYAKANEKK